MSQCTESCLPQESESSYVYRPIGVRDPPATSTFPGISFHRQALVALAVRLLRISHKGTHKSYLSWQQSFTGTERDRCGHHVHQRLTTIARARRSGDAPPLRVALTLAPHMTSPTPIATSARAPVVEYITCPSERILLSIPPTLQRPDKRNSSLAHDFSRTHPTTIIMSHNAGSVMFAAHQDASRFAATGHVDLKNIGEGTFPSSVHCTNDRR